jgi:hypothetical protein
MTHQPEPQVAAAPDRLPGQGGPIGAQLADEDLAEEIELYTDVVVAASESDGPMPEGELDRVLGVEGGLPPE